MGVGLGADGCQVDGSAVEPQLDGAELRVRRDAPAYLTRQYPMPSPLFPWVRTGVENIGAANLVTLFVVGGALGALFCGRGRPAWPFLVGMGTMALFPVFAIAEMFADPTSHNLFPFEFVMYFLVGLIAVAGAYVGYVGRRLASVERTDET